MAPGRKVEASDHHAAVGPTAHEYRSPEAVNRPLSCVRIHGQCPTVKLDSFHVVAHALAARLQQGSQHEESTHAPCTSSTLPIHTGPYDHPNHRSRCGADQYRSAVMTAARADRARNMPPERAICFSLTVPKGEPMAVAFDEVATKIDDAARVRWEQTKMRRPYSSPWIKENASEACEGSVERQGWLPRSRLRDGTGAGQRDSTRRRLPKPTSYYRVTHGVSACRAPRHLQAEGWGLTPAAKVIELPNRSVNPRMEDTVTSTRRSVALIT